MSEVFLHRNGYRLTCDDDELVAAFLKLAAGELATNALAQWFRRWIALA